MRGQLVPTLKGRRIALLGGDRRELELARVLIQLGARVKVVGFPPSLPELVGAIQVKTAAEALADAEVVVAPMSNTDQEGRIKVVLDPNCEIHLTDELFSVLPPGTPFFIGAAKPCVRELAARHQLCLIETAEIDEIAVLNSIPTAEGAIQIAMEELPITIHGSRSVVLGFGRCGMTLARMLAGIGAQTTVVARNPVQLARAREMGLRTATFDELAETVKEAEIIFNTVPAVVLTRDILVLLDRDVLIVDIASAPGGVDYAAARELGIDAILAPGLPGKVAPKTAGQILAQCLPALIAELLQNKTGA